jgi:hypothetical protein
MPGCVLYGKVRFIADVEAETIAKKNRPAARSRATAKRRPPKA